MAKVVLLCVEIRLSTIGRREGKGVQLAGQPPSRARRGGQIRGMIEPTVGMYGDFQAIAGKALEEIDDLTQIARRVEARRKRGPTNRRVGPISARGRTH
jgi:hypothetical protein